MSAIPPFARCAPGNLPDGFPYPVFHLPDAKGPGVIVLHELPGLSPLNLQLAEKIAHAGFRVYLPCLFGTPGQENQLVGLSAFTQSCIRENFARLVTKKSTKLTQDIQTLTRWVAQETTGPVGIVGLCMTGNFALSAIADPQANIKAAVSCEPTGYVFLEEEAIRKNLTTHEGHILAFRYEKDWKCKASQLQIINQAFPKQAECYTLTSQDSNEHSVLARHFRNSQEGIPGYPNALEKTIAFLRQQLNS